MTNGSAWQEAFDLATLDRITEILRLRNAASPQAERGAVLRELRQIRNMLVHGADVAAAGSYPAGLTEGLEPEELLASLLALEATSLGTAAARRVRSTATAARLTRVLEDHEQPGPGSRAAAAEDRPCRPDPLNAKTPAELVTVLCEYRAWAGSPGYREMASRANQQVAYSTMFKALNHDKMPSLQVVIAVITGCGGHDDDLRSFATAWRRIRASAAEGSGSKALHAVEDRGHPEPGPGAVTAAAPRSAD